MRRKSLHRQLFPTYLAIILVCLLASGWLISRLIHQFYLDQLNSDLRTRIALVKERLEGQFTTPFSTSLDSLCKSLGRLSATRITAIDSSGHVLGDTDENPAVMENHSDRPEFKEALSGTMGTALRFSPTLQKKMLYLAVPVMDSGRVVGALRAAIPVTAINEALHQIYGSIAWVGLIIAVIGGGISYWISRRISRPLAEMRDGARLIAQGDFSRKVLVPDLEELAALSEALNKMAEHLSGRIGDLTRQRNELEAVLSSMVEGVVAVDAEERILSINQAAASLLDLQIEKVRGRFIQEVISHPELQRFFAKILADRRSLEEEMALRSGRLFLQAHGTPLRDAAGREIGALVVLNDVTQLRRLENIRKEFVANVSHELRTPITSIKGFVETLQDGALKDEIEAAHFLGIISKHVDRLSTIIEDLLSLSRLEQGAERGEIRLEMGDLRDAIMAAIQSCEPKAAEKNIRFHIATEAEQKVKINPVLLEQAVMNLLDNALKYSPPGGEVRVGVEKTEAEFVLFVQDFGCGIVAEHLLRVFERFYRVNRNRSRELGGTGLGLAIVKHIALAHSGRVSVESQPGKGSVFRIHLPRAV